MDFYPQPLIVGQTTTHLLGQLLPKFTAMIVLFFLEGVSTLLIGLKNPGV